ncbi:MAG: ABC transporter ATP-binding protein [Candidatus Competibacterales bacterium]
MSAAAHEPLLRVSGLTKYFPITKGVVFKRILGQVRAVDGVSFDLAPRETLALVGESGCGKSTTGRLLLRLLEPSAGNIEFQGREITRLRGRQLRALRRQIQIVFQDPFGSLNPRMTVEAILCEPLRVHGLGDSGQQRRQRALELLELVGLSSFHLPRHPHEFSGGQRQRIGIARALAVNPALVVCDEPVSALDVSVQGQVLNLLKDLQERLGVAYVFIAHDLAVVKHMSDRIAIMYLGQIVEEGDSAGLYRRPYHPYTQTLLSAIPRPVPGRPKASLASAEVPSALAPPPGCRFHPRCPHARARCREEMPQLRAASGGRRVACHFFEEIPLPEALADLQDPPPPPARLDLYRRAVGVAAAPISNPEVAS